MAGSGRPRLAGEEEAHRRVRIPYYPLYSEVRHLLCVWPGRLRKQVTGLQTNLGELRGNPQKTADWTDSATWIPERLAGDDLELAQAVWDQSKGAVNPRFTHGHWLLAHRYLLDEDGNGILELTEAGQDFLKHPGGETETRVDEAEGLIRLLSIVADHGPTWQDRVHRQGYDGPATEKPARIAAWSSARGLRN